MVLPVRGHTAVALDEIVDRIGCFRGGDGLESNRGRAIRSTVDDKVVLALERSA
jgi:hypothetical protein